MLRIDQFRIDRLRRALDGLQFDGVQRAMRADYALAPFPRYDDLERDVRRLPTANRLCYELLLLGKPARRADMARHLGVAFLDDLMELGIVEATGDDRVQTDNYALISYGARYFVVSLTSFYPTCRDKNMAIYAGPDSYTLAASLPLASPVASVLDLGSGSGLQGIVMAPLADRVVAVDVLTDAVQATRFNAALNGLSDKIDVREGSFFEPVEGMRFDVIVADPPFVPVPDAVPFPVFGNGGPDGMRYLGPLLDQLAAHLTATGTAYLYAGGMGDRRQPFLMPVLEHIAERDRLAIDLLVVALPAVGDSLLSRARVLVTTGDPDLGQLAHWQAMYEGHGATHTYYFNLRIGRGTPRVGVINPCLA